MGSGGTSAYSGLSVIIVSDTYPIISIHFATSIDGWCVGGESVYRQLMPYCDKAFITVADADFSADQFCPNLDSNKEWRKEKESKYKWNGIMKYRYVEYRRKDGAVEGGENAVETIIATIKPVHLGNI